MACCFLLILRLRGLPERLFWEGPPDGPLAPVPAPRAVLAPDVFLCTAITLPVYGHHTHTRLGSPPFFHNVSWVVAGRRPESLSAVIVKAGDAGGKLNLVLPSLSAIFPGQRGSSGKLAQRGEDQTAHLSIRALESLARAGAALPQSGGRP